MHVAPLYAGHKDDAVDVVCDAFADYPVMRFVIGDAGADYARRARRMVDFFVSARFLNGDLVLGAFDGAALAGVANISLPGDRPVSPAIAPLREALWRDLGAEAHARYEALTRVWQTFAIDRPHYHLNMLGVRRSAQKRGVGRRLLDALHDLSAQAPESCGVSLTTEDPANVPLYEHCGYHTVGHAQVAPSLETWGFFRPDDAS